MTASSRPGRLFAFVALVGAVGCNAEPRLPDDMPLAPRSPLDLAAEAEQKAYYALPAGAVRRLGDLHARHGSATTVHFCADGKTMLTGGAPGVLAWDATTHNLLRQYPAGSYTGWPLTSTPDGRFMVAMGNGEVHVLSRASGKSVHTLAAAGQRIACFALALDGKTVATGSWEGELWLWDAETGKRKDFLAVHPPVHYPAEPFRLPQTLEKPPIMHVGFSPDGSTVASSGTSDVIRGWDVKTAKQVWSFDRANTSYGPFAFSPDGKLIAIPTYRAAPDKRKQGAGIGLWRFSDGTRPVELDEEGFGGGAFGAYCMAFSPDGRYFATGGGDGKLRVWDARTGKFHFTSPVPSSIQEVQFSRDGKTLACVSNGITLWDVATGKERVIGVGHVGALQTLAMTPDGKTVFTAGTEGTIRAWNAVDGSQKWVTPYTPDDWHGWAYAIALAPNGKELAVVSSGGAVRVRDIATGKELRRMPGVKNQAFAIAYSPDGKTLAALGQNLTVALWDAETGKEKGELVGYDGYGGSGAGMVLQFTPDGKHVIAPVRQGPGGSQTPGPDGQPAKTKFDPNAGPGSEPDGRTRLVLWDFATGKRVRVLGTSSEHGHLHAAFSPDGKTLAVRDSNDVAVIDFASGKELRRFAAEWGTTTFAPDGNLWAGPVCYDPATGKKVAEVAGAKGASVLSADGRVLVTGEEGKGSVLVWNLPIQ